MINKSYVTVVESIKEQIRCAKHKAILNVNKEMLILYWNIGKIINENSTWGSKFLKNLSIEIKREFPLTKGFSVSNLKNALGNINYIVDETGSIMVKYSYDEWGVPTKTIVQPSCPIGELNPFMYKSYYFDSDTEMYYLNSRYYYPYIRRFLSVDNTEYLEKESLGNLNLYLYCNNNPISYSDPSGKSIWLALLGVVASGLITGFSAMIGKTEEESSLGAFVGDFIDGAIGAVAIAAGVATGGLGGLIVTASLSFVGGGVGNAVNQLISFGDVQWKPVLAQGFLSAFTNSFNFGAIYLSGIVDGVKWITKFKSALEISTVSVGISTYLASFSLFNANQLREDSSSNV